MRSRPEGTGCGVTVGSLIEIRSGPPSGLRTNLMRSMLVQSGPFQYVFLLYDHGVQAEIKKAFLRGAADGTAKIIFPALDLKTKN